MTMTTTTIRTSTARHPVRSLVSRSRSAEEGSEGPETAVEGADALSPEQTAIRGDGDDDTRITEGKGDGSAEQAEQAGQSRQTRQAPQIIDAATLKEREDQAMSFVESADSNLTYHQASLIRLACMGLTSEAALREAQYVLDRAKAVAGNRPATLPLDAPFQESVMEFVESEAWHLSYCEADIIRRIGRGCNSGELEEVQFLLDRVRKALAASR